MTAGVSHPCPGSGAPVDSLTCPSCFGNIPSAGGRFVPHPLPGCAGCGSTAGLFIGDSDRCVACEDPEKPPCLCRGAGETELPTASGDMELYPCPVCRPWGRFPGLQMGGHWLVPPYGPGDTPTLYAYGAGPVADRPV